MCEIAAKCGDLAQCNLQILAETDSMAERCEFELSIEKLIHSFPMKASAF